MAFRFKSLKPNRSALFAPGSEDADGTKQPVYALLCGREWQQQASVVDMPLRPGYVFELMAAWPALFGNLVIMFPDNVCTLAKRNAVKLLSGRINVEILFQVGSRQPIDKLAAVGVKDVADEKTRQ